MARPTLRRCGLLLPLLAAACLRSPSPGTSSTTAAMDAAVAPAPPPPPHLIGRAGEAMGTVVEIKVWGVDDARARVAIGEAFDEISRLERLMTTWRPDSDISRVNEQAGIAPVEVSPETLEVVERAQEFAVRSGGAFDITFYAMQGLWKFDHDLEARLPDPKEVARRRRLIDHRQLIVDHDRRTLFLRRPGMRLNLGGIAKGYAVDRATAILRRAGFADAIVQAGGDLMLAGSKGGKPWQAGVRDPRGGRDDYFAVAAVVDHAFSTAGDYERFFLVGGKRYHHIIDPRTGYPASAARSVTVFARDATTADGIDDAILILGPDQGLALLAAYPGAGAVVVDAKNRVHVSPGLAGLVQILHPPTDGP